MKTPSETDVTEQPKRVARGSLRRMVGGRSNPKRLAELAESLHNLRDMARLESSCCSTNELGARKVWREVEDWADGTAMKYKLNLAAVQSEQEGARVPKATPDANGEVRLETRLSAGGVESSNAPDQR
jgi:protein subunit release factor A